MDIVITAAVAAVCVMVVIRILVINSEKIQFYAVGFDSGFRLSEIRTLWRLARINDLETPLSLFASLPSLNKCISRVIIETRKDGSYDTGKIQLFLQKLYDYRTRVALDAKKRMGIESTRALKKGQRLRIILKGKGVFSSRVLDNKRELVISLPVKYSEELQKFTALKGSLWEGKDVSVYLWRKDDASYVFESKVLAEGNYLGSRALFLRHSFELERAQKRQSIRVKCSIQADMYFIRYAIKDYDAVETKPGFKVLLEDISEDGAMVRIGGKGKSSEKIKLQFSIGNDLIMMYGTIRSVEFNKTLNQSRLHFECTHIAPSMRNTILTFVYKILPDEEKERKEAIDLVENDSRESLENKNESVTMKDEPNAAEDINELEELEELEEIDEEKTGA